MIEKVGVVGCGLMGAGIAEVCARAELDVIVVESSPAAVAAGIARLEKSLQRAELKGKIASAATVLAHISVVQEIALMADRDLVVEAIAENESAKVSLFAALDEIVASPTAILASNTSSIPITKLGVATKRPSHVLGLHFFNPVPVMTLVELVPSLLTDPAVLDQAAEFAEKALGKHTIRSQDQAGFIVNALLVPYLLSAIRMLGAGLATAEDIDEGMMRGCAHPQGPLALTDLIGLDTIKAVAESLYEEYKDPSYAAPPLLARMVEAGLHGRKTGRGFYSYA